MRPSLQVIAPGLSTTIQDLGRFGHRDEGIPVGGALDPEALELANALVGNALDSAGLEVLYVGPELRVDAKAVRLAVVGREACLRLATGERIPQGCSVTLSDGSATALLWCAVPCGS